jgi:outer membrane biogenesis lipoprotein LolB
MKKLVSFVLGTVVLVGAATFGLQSANAKDKHDKNYWKHHHKHHKHHRHYRTNHLSY